MIFSSYKTRTIKFIESRLKIPNETVSFQKLIGGTGGQFSKALGWLVHAFFPPAYDTLLKLFSIHKIAAIFLQMILMSKSAIVPWRKVGVRE